MDCCIISVLFNYLIIKELITSKKESQTSKVGFINAFNKIITGFEKGAVNMVSVGIAIATAGIIVGAVSSTGLSNNLVIIVEAISGGNIIYLLGLTAFLCIILGMGLPTTANYLVVAALMANVVVEVGSASGYVFPLIAIHLYVFYYGLMADVTPPVGLASYAAAAISRADPIKTGIQAFWYSLRTGILPIVFIFNNELLLIGIENWFHGIVVMITSLIAILVFTAATQGWFVNKLKWYEIIVFLLISLALFRPGLIMDQFYPEFNQVKLNTKIINETKFQSDQKVQIKVTRQTAYGPRYKMFEIPKDSFDQSYSLEEYGINLVTKKDSIIIDTLKWNGIAKKSGFETDDILTEIKIENKNRPDKDIVYPFALLVLALFGYLNYRKQSVR